MIFAMRNGDYLWSRSIAQALKKRGHHNDVLIFYFAFLYFFFGNMSFFQVELFQFEAAFQRMHNFLFSLNNEAFFFFSFSGFFLQGFNPFEMDVLRTGN